MKKVIWLTTKERIVRNPKVVAYYKIFWIVYLVYLK